MSKKSSDKYYQKNREKLPKSNGIKDFLMKRKTKRNNTVENNVKISQRMKKIKAS